MSRPPPGTRVVLDPIEPGRWRVVIPGRPTRGLMFFALFLLSWLAGWAVGEVFALRALYARQKDPGLDLAVLGWVAAWTAGGVSGVWLLRRVLGISFGMESLLLSRERLRYIRTLWGRVFSRDFAMKRVERFDVGGRFGLRFRAEGRWTSFGVSLTEEERTWLIEELRKIVEDVRRGSLDVRGPDS